MSNITLAGLSMMYAIKGEVISITPRISASSIIIRSFHLNRLLRSAFSGVPPTVLFALSNSEFKLSLEPPIDISSQDLYAYQTINSTIRRNLSSISITHCTFASCTNRAIYFCATDSSIAVESSIFSDCYTPNGGGAIFANSKISNISQNRFERCFAEEQAIAFVSSSQDNIFTRNALTDYTMINHHFFSEALRLFLGDQTMEFNNFSNARATFVAGPVLFDPHQITCRYNTVKDIKGSLICFAGYPSVLDHSVAMNIFLRGHSMDIFRFDRTLIVLELCYVLECHGNIAITWNSARAIFIRCVFSQRQRNPFPGESFKFRDCSFDAKDVSLPSIVL